MAPSEYRPMTCALTDWNRRTGTAFTALLYVAGELIMDYQTSGAVGFSAAEQEVSRWRPGDLKAPNQNDVRSFVHAWFAAFDHADATEFFLGHLDDADMTFDTDGEALAHDHASFRAWYADALTHIPWDFREVRDIAVTGLATTGWTAEFYFRHVGHWRDDPGSAPDAAAGRPFYRVLKANCRLEHVGVHFVIRRYELVTAKNILPI